VINSDEGRSRENKGDALLDGAESTDFIRALWCNRTAAEIFSSN
jgi:hypothetical protein